MLIFLVFSSLSPGQCAGKFIPCTTTYKGWYISFVLAASAGANAEEKHLAGLRVALGWSPPFPAHSVW
jgi:hypothetical protein